MKGCLFGRVGWDCRVEREEKPQQLEQTRWTRWQASLFLIASNIALRSIWLSFMHPKQMYDFNWYETHAIAMMNGHGYTSNGHYTAYWPILWPYVLSLLFRAFGPHAMVGLIANAIFSTVTVCGIYWLSLTIGLTKRVSLTASVAYTLLPSQLAWNSVLGSEELFTCLGVLALLAFAFGQRAGRDKQEAWWVTLSGLLFGVASGVRPIPLLFPVFVLGYFWVKRRIGPASGAPIWVGEPLRAKRVIGLTLAFCGGIALGVFPVTLRNFIALHHFVLVSLNGGVNLWQGTHADGSYYWSWNPAQNPLLKAGHDEILQNQIGMHAALAHILSHPFETLVHIPIKWFFLYWVDWNVVSVTFAVIPGMPHWGVVLAMWSFTLIYWVWMIPAVIGMVAFSRQPGRYGAVRLLPVLIYVGYTTLVFSFFPAWDRFRVPIMPYFAILFGIGWAHLRTRRSGIDGVA